MIKMEAHTEESTSSLSTSLGDPSDNSFSRMEVKFSTGKVIKEKEGLCSLGSHGRGFGRLFPLLRLPLLQLFLHLCMQAVSLLLGHAAKLDS